MQKPNVVIWLLDDVGYGQLSPFGGPIEMPTLDRLASRGLRFTNFHSTGICSPSRVALLNGRNHHAQGMGNHAGLRTNDPGYTARVPRNAASLATVLRRQGYSTYALGKWDQFPIIEATSDGPYTLWPSGQGFDRFYGFLYADMDHYHPTLWQDHTPIDAPRDPNYHLTTDLTDRAIGYLRDNAASSPNKPFFLYFATGAAHAPHHAPREWRDRYRGRFDRGWDEQRVATLLAQKKLGIVANNAQLPPRDAKIATWKSMTPDERRMAARSMENFAGMLSHADQQFGRIIAEIERRGQLDNTIVLVMSDNGASGEGAPNGSHNEWRAISGLYPSVQDNLAHYDDWGGPSTYPHYPAGWAMAGNTPFRHYKTLVHEGGVRGPMIFYFPARIAAHGEVRPQFHHLIDVMPTVLELAGIAMPESVDGERQMPIDGTSMAYALASSAAPPQHTRQYFEIFGNRAMVADGWKAVVAHRPVPWDFFRNWDYANDVWELYDLNRDFNETHDLARAQPAKLKELQALFDAQAARDHIYPLTPDVATFKRNEVAAQVRARHGVFAYRGVVRGISGDAAPPTLGGQFDLESLVDVPSPNMTAVLVAHGGAQGGISLYVKDGRPSFCYNLLGFQWTYVRSAQPLVPGRHSIGLQMRRLGAERAQMTLLVDGTEVDRAEIPKLAPMMYESSDGLSVGLDQGSTVAPELIGLDIPARAVESVEFRFSAAK